MSIEVVNGYVCRNCTDVEFAKKGVDPAHPKDGPEGVRAAEKTRELDKAAKADDAKAERGPAVTFGGQLASPAASPQSARPTSYTPGATLNLTA